MSDYGRWVTLAVDPEIHDTDEIDVWFFDASASCPSCNQAVLGMEMCAGWVETDPVTSQLYPCGCRVRHSAMLALGWKPTKAFLDG